MLLSGDFESEVEIKVTGPPAVAESLLGLEVHSNHHAPYSTFTRPGKMEEEFVVPRCQVLREALLCTFELELKGYLMTLSP